jgi:hypothetical protein
MRSEDHPARRPTRYHWAAGLNPLHWGVGLAGWIAVFVTGAAGAMGSPLGGLAPWLAAASLAWSGFWLVAVPNNPRFRRATDAALNHKYENDYEFQLALLYERVNAELYFKVQEMTLLRNRAREILQHKFGSYDPFAKDNLEKLDKLSISYLKLLTALSEYGEYLGLVNPESIVKDLDQARRAVEQAEPAIKPVREKQVTLLENRLARYRKAQTRIELINAECINIETTMKLLVDQAMTAPDSERVSRDIDQVLTNIRESEVLTQELAVFDDLERELDDTRLRNKELQ